MICSKMKTKGPQHAPTMAFGSLRASQDHETEIPDLLGDAAGSKSSSIVPGASPGHPRTCDLHCNRHVSAGDPFGIWLEGSTMINHYV